MIELLAELWTGLINTTWIEAIAVSTGLASVWYSSKEDIKVYPTGIISVLIYVWLCLQNGLYANMGINAIYFIMSVYGWWRWSHPLDSATDYLPVTRLSKKEWIITAVFVIVAFALLVWILSRWTDSKVPIPDAFTTAIFIAAMWMQAEKKVESWLLWIVGDLISVPLYFSVNMAFTSFQYMVFLVLAVNGYINWSRSYRLNEHN
ncbi:MAG: nicotinamide riboside transporter PnuC [Sphingobacteriia bacterium]|nr:nicotinamide riboside transporter PnuC [Sphingobacteriia bacterium]